MSAYYSQMKASCIRQIVRSLIFCALLIFCGAACSNEGNKDPQKLALVPLNINTQYQRWAVEALEAWNINLQSDNLGRLRNITPDYVPNPPHWITVADDSCEALGILDLIIEQCPFRDPSIVGVCFARAEVRNEDAGKILDTTIFVRRSALIGSTMGGSSGLTDDQKKAIFSHELGHCLGLQHWGNTSSDDSGLEPEMGAYTSHLMFPDTTGATSPAPGEIAAIAAVYGAKDAGCNAGEGACSNPSTLPNEEHCSMILENNRPTTAYATYEAYTPCYYAQARRSEDNYLRQRIYHPTLPVFYISGALGNAYAHGEMPALGEPLPSERMTIMYPLHIDSKSAKLRGGKVRYIPDN